MLQDVKIVSIEEVFEDETYDIWNFDDECQDSNGGNFLISDVVVHNSIPEAMQNRDDSRALWKNKLHPDILDILKDTYGVIVYQEQLQAIWQKLAGFTAPEAQEARKAVAKKWTHKLKPVRAKWLEGASKTLGRTEAEQWWVKMETFGRYAFNKCLSKDTILTDAVSGESKTVEQWYNCGGCLKLESYVGDKIVIDDCVTIHDNGEQEVYEVEFEDGTKESVTLAHKFMCSDGQYYTVAEIIEQRLDVIKIETEDRDQTKSS